MAVIVVAAATALGASSGCSASGEEDATATVTIRGDTVTVTETVVRRVLRPDPRAGGRVFANACSRCHVLRPPNWTGSRLNLTELRPAYGTTVAKVTKGGIAMPSFKGKLSRRQIRDVAAFVSRKVQRRGRPRR